MLIWGALLCCFFIVIIVVWPPACPFFPLPQGGRTPLHWAASRGYETTVTALIAGGADIAAKDTVSLLCGVMAAVSHVHLQWG